MSNDELTRFYHDLRLQINALPGDPFGSPEAIKLGDELNSAWDWYCERLAELREQQRGAEREIGYMLDVLNDRVRDYKPPVECACCHQYEAENDNGLCDGCDSDRIKMELAEAGASMI